MLLPLALLLALGFLGSRGLWEPDEGRYVEVAREMLVSGDWLVPTLHGVPHLTKPPLTYWAIAVSLAVFGRGEWAARLYLAFSFAATILLLARWGEELWEDPRGRWAGLVHGTTLLPFLAASVVTTDCLLAALEIAAMYALWRGWRAWPSSPGRGRAWYASGWGAFGLAFLAKGPPALLPLGGWTAFVLLARGTPWRRRSGFLRLPGPLVLAAVALPWFLLLAGSGRGVLGYLVVNEVLGRVLTGIHHRNSAWSGAVLVYGPALLLGGLPWTPAWLRLLPRWGSRARRGEERRLLLACWFLVPLAVFLVARSRLAFYVVPLFAPLSLAVAGGISGEGSPGGRAGRRAAWTVIAAIPVLLALRGGAAFLPLARDTRALAREIRSRVPAGDLAEAEVLPVGRTIHGLGFYLGLEAEDLTGRTGQGPTWWRAGDLAEEVEEVGREATPHLLVVSRRRLAWTRARLAAAGADCRDLGEARGESFLLCRGRRSPGRRSTLRLLLVRFDPGDLAAAFGAAHRAFEAWERTTPAAVLVVEPRGAGGILRPASTFHRLRRRVPVLLLGRELRPVPGSGFLPGWFPGGGKVAWSSGGKPDRVEIRGSGLALEVRSCCREEGSPPGPVPAGVRVLACAGEAGEGDGLRVRVLPGGRWRTLAGGMGLLEAGAGGVRVKVPGERRERGRSARCGPAGGRRSGRRGAGQGTGAAPSGAGAAVSAISSSVASRPS